MYFTELPQDVQERFHWVKPDGAPLFWQKSSLPGLLSSPTWGLLSVISVLDDSRQREQDAHRDGKRFIVRAHEKLTAFFELQRAIDQFAVSLIPGWPVRNGPRAD